MNQFDALEKQIDSCTTCEELSEVAQEVSGVVDAQSKALTEKIAPIKAIVDAFPPRPDPRAIVDFLKILMAPHIAAVASYTQEMAQLAANAAAIQAKLSAKISTLSCNISTTVNIPTPPDLSKPEDKSGAEQSPKKDGILAILVK